MTRIYNGKDSSVYAFIREAGNNRVLTVVNLTSKEQTIKLKGNMFAGTYDGLFSGKKEILKPNSRMVLKPWEFKVFHNTRN